MVHLSFLSVYEVYGTKKYMDDRAPELYMVLKKKEVKLLFEKT